VVVDTVLGLLGLAVFVLCVIAFAAAMTWVVVKLSPTRSGSAQQQR
jgi:hypothetical protein